MTNSTPSRASTKASVDWPTSTPRANDRRRNPLGSARRPTPKKSATESSSNPPSKRKWKRRNRREEILRRLEVDADLLATEPQIGYRLRQNGIPPQRLADILRCDGAPESQAFVGVWDRLTPADRALAGIEALAMAAGITPRRLYEVFAGAAMMQSREDVGLTIALALPNAMRVTVREAQKAKGHFAREHLFKAARVLPVPKGSTTNINVGNQKELPEPDESTGDLEPADPFLLRAAKAMYPTKALPAPTVAVDSEEDDSEE